MKSARQLREEAIALFDDRDSRTFEDIYGKGQIFEDQELADIIHPKMRKLFEEVHSASRPIQGASRRLREAEQLDEESDEEPGIREGQEELDELEEAARKNVDEFFASLREEAPKYDLASSKDTPRPSGDGVPSNHNNGPNMGGSSPAVTQSGPRQDDNSKLGSEPPMGHGAGPKKRQQESVVKMFEEVYVQAHLEEKRALREEDDDDDDDDSSTDFENRFDGETHPHG